MRRALAARTDVVACVTGMGQVAAARAAAEWLPRVSAVIVCGLAGGLDERVASGNVVVATGVIDASGAEVGRVQVVEVPGACAGVVASVAEPADDAEARAALRALGALVVETEAAAWVRAAADDTVDVVVVRAVLDTPQRRLGRAAGMVAEGATRPRVTTVASAVARPGEWGRLLRVARLAAVAERRAAEAAAAIAVALARRS